MLNPGSVLHRVLHLQPCMVFEQACCSLVHGSGFTRISGGGYF